MKLLDWDSQFFGHRIARIESERLDETSLATALDWCCEHRIDCLYFLCAPDDDRSVQLAEASGFHLVDIRVELSCRLQSPPPAPSAAVRPFRAADLDALQRIAADAYRDTRFWYDAHFNSEQAAALYREWIAKSCRSDDDVVLVAPDQDNVQGFITCSFEGGAIGRIGLLGVDANARGAGMGRALVNVALLHCSTNGCNEIRVVTQGRNIAAQRLYQSTGFRTLAVHLWYHKWFGQNGQ